MHWIELSRHDQIIVCKISLFKILKYQQMCVSRDLWTNLWVSLGLRKNTFVSNRPVYFGTRAFADRQIQSVSRLLF